MSLTDPLSISNLINEIKIDSEIIPVNVGEAAAAALR